MDLGHRVDRGLSAHAADSLAEALESGGHLTHLSALTAAPVGQEIRHQRDHLLGLALDLGRVTRADGALQASNAMSELSVGAPVSFFLLFEKHESHLGKTWGSPEA